jgi:hypothetical protein
MFRLIAMLKLGWLGPVGCSNVDSQSLTAKYDLFDLAIKLILVLVLAIKLGEFRMAVRINGFSKMFDKFQPFFVGGV